MRDSLTTRHARKSSAGDRVCVAGALICSAPSASRPGDTFYLRLATEALIFGGLALSVDHVCSASPAC